MDPYSTQKYLYPGPCFNLEINSATKIVNLVEFSPLSHWGSVNTWILWSSCSILNKQFNKSKKLLQNTAAAFPFQRQSMLMC